MLSSFSFHRRIAIAPAHLACASLRLYTEGVKIALGQINPTVGDFSGNAGKIIDFSRRAQAAGAGLILFPELSVCGYPPRDLVERPSFVAKNRETVEQIAAETSGIAVICGLVTPAHSDTGKAVMNSAALLMDGKVAFLQSKMLLPTYDVFDEMRNFAPAKSQELFSFCGNRMALTICEDAWNDKHFWRKQLYTVDPVDSLIRAGGNFVLNISASPFWIGKRELRRDMLASIARQHKVPVVLVNQVGGNDSLVFDGSSVVLNREGNIIAQGDPSKKIWSISIRATCRAKCTNRLPETKPAPTPRWCWARATTCTSADFRRRSSA